MRIPNGSIELDVADDGDPSAPPMLLLHGITSFGGKREWIVPTLSERFCVLAAGVVPHDSRIGATVARVSRPPRPRILAR